MIKETALADTVGAPAAPTQGLSQMVGVGHAAALGRVCALAYGGGKLPHDLVTPLYGANNVRCYPHCVAECGATQGIHKHGASAGAQFGLRLGLGTRAWGAEF